MQKINIIIILLKHKRNICHNKLGYYQQIKVNNNKSEIE